MHHIEVYTFENAKQPSRMYSIPTHGNHWHCFIHFHLANKSSLQMAQVDMSRVAMYGGNTLITKLQNWDTTSKVMGINGKTKKIHSCLGKPQQEQT